MRIEDPPEDESVASSSAPVAPVSRSLRLLAGTAGLLALAAGTIATFGAVLAGAVGVWIVAGVARARSRQVTRLQAWGAAVSFVALYAVAGGAMLVRDLPDGTIERILAAADSASAAEPPPEWLQRVAPRTAEEMSDTARVESIVDRAFTVYCGLIGVALVCAALGSVGWGCAMLLTMGFTGRWIPPAPQSRTRGTA
jgi:hypothetical protein